METDGKDAVGTPTETKRRGNAGLTLVAVVSMLVGLASVAVEFTKQQSRANPAAVQKPTWDPAWVSPTTLTPDQLAAANGDAGTKGTYLAIMGEVYDVGNSEHYAKTSGYHIFVGRDATRAFVTGDFSPSGASDDVSDLTPVQMKSVENWVDFYRKHETYAFVGVVSGRFYTPAGARTQAWRDAVVKLSAAEKQQAETDRVEKIFPSCSSRWEQNAGTTFWCDGRTRDAQRKLVPRRFKSLSASASGERCACVDPLTSQPSSVGETGEFIAYAGCAPSASECKLPEGHVVS